MNVYALWFNAAQIEPSIVLERLKRSDHLRNWLAVQSNFILVRSATDVSDVSKAFEDDFPNLQYFVTAVEPSKVDGWLPRTVWDFVNEPRPLQSLGALLSAPGA